MREYLESIRSIVGWTLISLCLKPERLIFALGGSTSVSRLVGGRKETTSVRDVEVVLFFAVGRDGVLMGSRPAASCFTLHFGFLPRAHSELVWAHLNRFQSTKKTVGEEHPCIFSVWVADVAI